MGKYKPGKVNHDKKKKQKNNVGPCGRQFGSKKCSSIKRNSKKNQQCREACSFGQRKQGLKKRTMRQRHS